MASFTLVYRTEDDYFTNELYKDVYAARVAQAAQQFKEKVVIPNEDSQVTFTPFMIVDEQEMVVWTAEGGE